MKVECLAVVFLCLCVTVFLPTSKVSPWREFLADLAA